MPLEERLQAISFAARPAVVGRYLGELLLAIGLLTLVPVVITGAFGDWFAAGTQAAAALAMITIAFGLRRMKASKSIQINEAMVVASLAFVLAPLGAIVPFMVSTGAGSLDAFFEAVSAVTTTGLTTLPSLDGLPESFHFTRAWMQWYGGLGVVTLSIPLLGSAGLAARRIALAEVDASLAPEGVRTRARHAIVVYTALTLIGVVLLFAVGATPFDSVVHALTGVSTGGFSSHDDSLAAIGSWTVQAVATGLGLCGAVALPVYYRVRHEGLRALSDDIELRALIGGCLVLSILLGIAMILESHLSLEQALRAAPLLATSAQTTTGFTPLQVAELGPTAKLLLIVSMLTGGSVGSTAGGMKLLRILITLRLLGWAVSRTRFVPHAVSEMRLAGESLGMNEIQRVLVVVMLFLLTVGLSWLPFVASGYDPMNALFEVASAVATTGLTAGIARPELEAPLKMVLCVDMLLGRVEVLALLVLLSPGTWRGRRAT